MVAGVPLAGFLVVFERPDIVTDTVNENLHLRRVPSAPTVETSIDGVLEVLFLVLDIELRLCAHTLLHIRGAVPHEAEFQPVQVLVRTLVTAAAAVSGHNISPIFGDVRLSYHRAAEVGRYTGRKKRDQPPVIRLYRIERLKRVAHRAIQRQVGDELPHKEDVPPQEVETVGQVIVNAAMCAVIIETVAEAEAVYALFQPLVNQQGQDKKVLHRVFVPLLVALYVQFDFTKREAARPRYALGVTLLTREALIHAADIDKRRREAVLCRPYSRREAVLAAAECLFPDAECVMRI